LRPFLKGVRRKEQLVRDISAAKECGCAAIGPYPWPL